MEESRQTPDAFRAYLRDIAQIPLIDREEEIDLATRIKQGDDTARQKLITANLRLVVKIAHDYRGYGSSLEELISGGNTGLTRAVEKFDPEKGAKFSTYAAWWIRHSIRKELNERGKTVRVPIAAAGNIHKIRLTRERHEYTHGYAPTIQQISEKSGLTKRVIRGLEGSDLCIVSLDHTIISGRKDTLGELIPDDPEKDPFVRATDSEYRARIMRLIEELLPRERTVLEARYGLDGKGPKTLEEVSKIIGRTRERVRQIQNYALRKLRALVNEEENPSGAEAAGSQDPAGYSERNNNEAIRAYHTPNASSPLAGLAYKTPPRESELKNK